MFSLLKKINKRAYFNNNEVTNVIVLKKSRNFNNVLNNTNNSKKVSESKKVNFNDCQHHQLEASRRLFHSCSQVLFSNANSNKSEKKYSSSSGGASSPPSADDSLTLNKSKRLMRLIYARVHPDLFTNYLQAQVNTK